MGSVKQKMVSHSTNKQNETHTKFERILPFKN